MTTTILSFGGGVDSTTLIAIDLDRDRAARYIGISRSDLDAAFPSPDAVVFSDTGAESAATYGNIIKAQEALGSRFHRVSRDGENITDWCLRLGIVPLLPGGSHICSLKFKGEVMQKWAAQKFAGQDLVWQIGIELNEEKRVKRFSAPKGEGTSYTYPLMELGLGRNACIDLLKHLGWGPVEKSSCVFCPFKTEGELRDMYQNDQDGWRLSEKIERQFEKTSAAKHQAWLDAGQPLNRGGRAPRGMWRKDSWADGARLFARSSDGKRLSLLEWAAKFAEAQ